MKSKPNIIYILADDMGYGDLSCLNPDSKINTVNFDRLAKEGIAFTDAHASSAVCTPSRYSILTGRYNWRTPLKSGVGFGYSTPLIEDGRLTVASMLKDQGYKTACIGKWHLGLSWDFIDEENEIVDYSKPIKKGPNNYGFDYFYGISASLDMPPYVYIENNMTTSIPDHETGDDGEKTYWRKGPTAPDFKHIEVLPKLTEKAISKIDEYKDEPFFMYFPLPAPHTPILPTSEFQGSSSTNEYGDFVLMCDDVVGQIMDKLDELGIADNTILIYTSDNGCSPRADYDELGAIGHNPSYIFRGMKSDIFEGGHRIPLLIRWPDEIKAGGAVNQTVCLSDLMATIAEMLDIILPDNAGEDSVSNLSLWQGLTSYNREAIVHHSLDGMFSIRRGNWKLNMCPGSGGWSYPTSDDIDGLPSVQLYWLSQDIGEKVNVYDEYPEITQELTEVLTKYVKEGRSTKGTPQPNTGLVHWDQLNWFEE